MANLGRKIVKGESILNAMREKDLSKREEIYEMMMCENSEIAELYKEDIKEQYASVPDYLIPILEDGYKKQNTMLVCMYVIAVKRLILNLEKINGLFNANYKTLADAKNNMFDWCFEELGFNCETIKAGRRISGYRITPNYQEIERLISEFKEE